MKKFLLFAAALCFSATMFAQDIFQDDQGLYYEVIYEDDVATGNCQIIACQDEGEVYEGEITIPDKVNGYNVTRIGDNAFDNSSIEGDLVIPGTILNLGYRCFANCDGLTSVTFEYSEEILADENTTTYNSDFADCDNITVVYLDRDVNTASSGAVAPFSYVCCIETVYIGEHVTSLPPYMFRANNTNNGGGTLATIYSDAAEPPTLGNDAVFGNSIRELGGDLILYTKADYLNDYKASGPWVDAIGTKANMHAYDGDDPDEPKNENAFQDEAGLWYEPIFDEDGNATDNCQLIAPPVQAEDQVYSGSITIPGTVSNNGTEYNVTRISDHAFANSDISGTVTIPGTILSTGVYAFQNCTGLNHVIFEYGPEELADDASANPGDYMFGGCSGVEWVELYRTVRAGSSSRLCTAFCYNDAVNTVIVGEAVTYIPQFMFYSQKGVLMQVTCYATEPPTVSTSQSPFNMHNDDCVLYVYRDYISTYEESDWGALGFAQILPIEDVPEGITDVQAETSAKVSGIFNVAGQRVNENAKGLLIKDGKKVLVK